MNMNKNILTDAQFLKIGQQWVESISELSDSERAPYEQWAIDNNVPELLQKIKASHVRFQQYLYENQRNSIRDQKKI